MSNAVQDEMPPTGFSRRSKFKFIELAGLTLVLIGVASLAAACWLVLVKSDIAYATAAAFGGCSVFCGIDLMLRPGARRLPKPARLADFILRLTSGIGPRDSTNKDTE